MGQAKATRFTSAENCVESRGGWEGGAGGA